VRFYSDYYSRLEVLSRKLQYASSMRISVDVITSAYNEEECLPELFARLEKIALVEEEYSFHFIVIDNGSTDRTWHIIKERQKTDGRYTAIRMSRNFSLDAAFTCGLDRATADIAIVMTSDLQDPPECIPELLRAHELGFEQVLVKVVDRGTVPALRRFLSNIFYRLANVMTGGMLPKSVSDFRLVSKKCYEAIRSLRESHRFLRGLGSWVGFETTYIEIKRPPRFAGESKWLGVSLVRTVLHGFQSIFAYSSLPLAWVSIFGVLMSLTSGILLIGLTLSWVLLGVPFAGFGSIVATVILCFSITILILGVIAQYISLIYEEVKQRPLYLVAEDLTDTRF
jgi:dolichol-phosphate mannosyltransferase